MCRFFETIKVIHKTLFNIEYHNQRMKDTRKKIFGSLNEIKLETRLQLPTSLTDQLYKCRVVYTEEIESIEFIPYRPKKIRSLQIIENDVIEYDFKYTDRLVFENILKHRTADEIVIIKNGFVTDASYANLVFFDGTKWFTPSTPLLKGAKRAELLNLGVIIETEISQNDIRRFKSVKLINAMLDWEEGSVIPVENIYRP
jgi:4-amino-4-deoxychorismate lyase